jgi:hypothetical protein
MIIVVLSVPLSEVLGWWTLLFVVIGAALSAVASKKLGVL